MDTCTFVVLVDCLKITEDKSLDKRVMLQTRGQSKPLVQSQDAGLEPASQHQFNTKMQGSKPVPKHLCNVKTQGSKPVSQHHFSAQIHLEACVSDAKLEVRV